MRRPRLLAPEGFSRAIYHCVSRVVDRRKVLEDVEKEQFVTYMRLYEKLCGLRILTFCVMGNHFHILVEVPRRPPVLPTDEALIKLVRETHGQSTADNLAAFFKRAEQQGNLEAIEKERARWFAQMWDLGRYMKVLKQRFSQWFNGRQLVRRTGTLWEDRYRSVLVENGQALQTMAAYIDLNPVRAGLVSDPGEYRWSGYGEVCAGKEAATLGLKQVVQSFPSLPSSNDEDVLAWYREQLYGRGRQVQDGEGRIVRFGFTAEEIKATQDVQGRLPCDVYVRLRVRYFTDGAVLGTKAFVESVFQARRKWFSSKRHSGARRLKGLELGSHLRVARALVVRPFG